MKPCTKALYVSLIIRCDSAAMVPNTSELLPEPETPVNTVSRRFGSSTLTSLRLFTRAPCTRIRSWLSAACSPGLSVLVAMLIAGTRRVARPGMRRRARRSADRLLHERGDPRLRARVQLRHGERDRPHLAVVQAGVGLEFERRVSNLELRCRLV